MTRENTEKPGGYEAALGGADRSVARFEAPRRSLLGQIQHFLHSNPTMVPVIVLVASIVVFGILTGGTLFTPFNLSLILQQVSIVGMLAAAQSLIILTAGIDLSVAAIMALMAVISGKLAVEFGVPAPLALLVAFAGGALAGTLNGVLVTRLKLPPFIVTLGTWNIFYSLTLYLSGAQSIRSQDVDAQAPLLKLFGVGFDVFGTRITYGSVLMVVLFLALWFLLNKTAWGKHVYAIGDDKDSAELSGIRTDRMLVSVYALAGLVCALTAWASIGRVGSVSPTSFYEANLHAITAVVVGGISLFGGRGSILGALFGALIVGVFNSGLRLVQVDVLWQVFAIGWLVIVAVAIDQWIRKVSA